MKYAPEPQPKARIGGGGAVLEDLRIALANAMRFGVTLARKIPSRSKVSRGSTLIG
jgi:hypothetical protein